MDTGIEQIRKGMHSLEAYSQPGEFIIGNKLTLADCAIVPVFFYIENIVPKLDQGNPLENCDILAGYWGKMKKNEQAKTILEDMAIGLSKL